MVLTNKMNKYLEAIMKIIIIKYDSKNGEENEEIKFHNHYSPI